MAYGIAGKTASGEVSFYFDENSVDSVGFIGASNNYTYNTYVGNPLIEQQEIISSPNERLRITRPEGSYFNLYVSGTSHSNGLDYMQPIISDFNGASSVTNWYRVTPLPSSCTSVGGFYKSSGEYGIKVLTSLGKNVFNDYSNFYVRYTDLSGQYLYTSTAPNLPSEPLGGGGYTEPLPQVITFYKPLTYPPLIMVTTTTGPVSFLSYIMDSFGRYVGASVVSPRAWGIGPSGGTDYGYYTAQTFNFTYYLMISHKDATPSPNYTYGMYLNNNSAFSGDYVTPPIKLFTIEKPYIRATFAFNGAYTITQYAIQSFTKPLNSGVMLNNINVNTGIMAISTYSFSGLRFGTINFTGNYFTSDGTNCTLAARGTNSIYVQFPAAGDAYGYSIDYFYSRDNQMSLFYNSPTI